MKKLFTTAIAVVPAAALIAGLGSTAFAGDETSAPKAQTQSAGATTMGTSDDPNATGAVAPNLLSSKNWQSRAGVKKANAQCKGYRYVGKDPLVNGENSKVFGYVRLYRKAAGAGTKWCVVTIRSRRTQGDAKRWMKVAIGEYGVPFHDKSASTKTAKTVMVKRTFKKGVKVFAIGWTRSDISSLNAQGAVAAR